MTEEEQKELAMELYGESEPERIKVKAAKEAEFRRMVEEARAAAKKPPTP